MCNHEIEKMNIDYVANIIVNLYSNKKLQNFIPTLNKGRNNTVKSKLQYMFINNDYSHIEGKESLDSILKKTIYANIPPLVELTSNGVMRNELKKGIEILKSHINNISANNKNGNFSDELIARKNELVILENKYNDCLQNGNFEIITDYKLIANQTLKLLVSASNDWKYRKDNFIKTLTPREEKAKELCELIHQKFGIEIDKRNKWQIEKENKIYEYKNSTEVENEYTKEYSRDYLKEPSREYHKNFIQNYNHNKKYHWNNNRNNHNEEKQTNKYIPPYKQIKEKNVEEFPSLINKEKEKNVEEFPSLINTNPIQIPIKPISNAWEKQIIIKKEHKDIENKKPVFIGEQIQNIIENNDDEWKII
jgi:hypothetical protein